MENFGTFTKELIHYQKSKGKIETNAWQNLVTSLVSKVGCPAKLSLKCKFREKYGILAYLSSNIY